MSTVQYIFGRFLKSELTFKMDSANMNDKSAVPHPPLAPMPPDVDLELEDTHPLSPLTIEDTLEVILSHVNSFQDLKSFRTVNSTWNRASSRELRARCQGWITFGEKIDNRIPTKMQLDAMRRFLDAYDGSSLLCTKFCVDTNFHQLDPDDDVEKQAVVETFFRKVAPFVKELKLREPSEVHGHRLFPCARPPADIQFPGLRSLSFDMGNLREVRSQKALLPDVVESNLAFMRIILANSPRLVAIQLYKEPLILSNSDGSGLSVLSHLSPHQHLQSLLLSGDLLDTPMMRLETMGNVHHLREFHIHICAMTNHNLLTRETLYRFLQLQRDSLEVLFVYMTGDIPFSVHLPSLPLLKDLEMASELSDELPVVLDRHFPALQKLTVGAWKIAIFFDFAVILQPMEAVTELQLKCQYEDFQADFQHVARVLPNLRKLWVYQEQGVENIRDLAPLEKVEELTVDCYDADLLLTGYDENTLGWWKLLPSLLLKTASLVATDPLPFLQRLKKLKITGYMVNLTDIACRLVLLRLPHLTCLDLTECSRSDDPGISAQVLAEMRNKFTVMLPANDGNE